MPNDKLKNSKAKGDRPVVILTGASGGIGAAVAGWLGNIGAAVTLLARSEKKLETVADDLRARGGQAFAFVADVTNPRACQKAVDATIERFKRLDALINVAGTIEPLGSIATVDPLAWQKNLAVNLCGPFYLCRAALGALRSQKGRIVNVSSGASEKSIQGASAYCVAKAGLNHFTRVLAAEEKEITAIAVRPGVVDTPMQAYLRRKGPLAMPKKTAAYYQSLKDEGRLEPPWIPARSIVWLATQAPPSFSGRFVNYDDTDIMEPARRRFQENF